MIIINSKNNLIVNEFSEQLAYQIQVGDKTYDIILSANKKVLMENMETPLALALPAAMRLRLPIFVDGSLSEQYLKKMCDLMKHYEDNYEDFHQVKITCKEVRNYTLKKQGGTATFFSGGVDSFYTLLKRINDINILIVLYGFDIKLKDLGKIKKTKQATNNVADILNKDLIEITGNITEIITDYCKWVTEGHGFALAAVSRALAGWLNVVYIPGTHSVNDKKSWGSTIFTDQQHSDDAISIIHDADQKERIEKLLYISENRLALENLRVCGDVPYDGTYNCSRCEKCVRTMLQLWSINKLDQVKTFHLPLTPKLVKKTLLIREGLKDYFKQALELGRKNKPNELEMLKAIEQSLARPVWLNIFISNRRRSFRHLKRNLINIGKKISDILG